MLRAILWDNDGVLVDTERLYFQAGRETLASMGVELTPEQFAEISLKQGESVFQLLPEQDPETIERLRQDRNRRYSDLLGGGGLVIDGAEAVLQQLHGQVAMGVVTGSRRDHFEIIHATTNLLRFFDFVVTREDYNRSKPDPDAYQTAMRQQGLSPEACVVVEDSERGCAAAVAAGIRCLVVPNPMTGAGDYPGAYRILDGIEAVVPAVRKVGISP